MIQLLLYPIGFLISIIFTCIFLLTTVSLIIICEEIWPTRLPNAIETINSDMHRRIDKLMYTVNAEIEKRLFFSNERRKIRLHGFCNWYLEGDLSRCQTRYLIYPNMMRSKILDLTFMDNNFLITKNCLGIPSAYMENGLFKTAAIPSGDCTSSFPYTMSVMAKI